MDMNETSAGAATEFSAAAVPGTVDENQSPNDDNAVRSKNGEVAEVEDSNNNNKDGKINENKTASTEKSVDGDSSNKRQMNTDSSSSHTENSNKVHDKSYTSVPESNRIVLEEPASSSTPSAAAEGASVVEEGTATTQQRQQESTTAAVTTKTTAPESTSRLPSKRPSALRPGSIAKPILSPPIPTPAASASADAAAKKRKRKKDAERKDAERKDAERKEALKERKRRRRHKRKLRHLLAQDAVLVRIPLHVTADLGIAVSRTRTKRIKSLRGAFPFLKEEEEHSPTDDNSIGDAGRLALLGSKEKGETITDALVQKENVQTKKKPKHIPQPNDYGSILDYLEAKYVQGVMVDVEDSRTKKKKKMNVGANGEKGSDVDESHDENDDEDDDDEGAGSVYSNDDSFLDDTDLQRNVAEQVLAVQTTTKVELMGDDDDGDDFFVNVGDLEVEETDLTQQRYDPLEDVQQLQAAFKKKKKKKKKSISATSSQQQKSSSSKSNSAMSSSMKSTKPGIASKSKKRKKPDSHTPDNRKGKKAGSGGSSSPSKKIAKSKNNSGGASNKNSTKKSSPLKISKKKPTMAAPAEENDNDSDSDSDSDSESKSKADSIMEEILDTAEKAKDAMDEAYAVVKDMIKNASHDELPRKKTKARVALTCPADKKPGDSVLFTNPHAAGQRLKVKIPKTCSPGGSFKVTVPVIDPSENNPETDYNKFSRPFYDAIDDFARTHDDWVDANAQLEKMEGNNAFAPHFEKRKKFDNLIKEFPNNLRTPIDKPYLQKILRRARQNKHKRSLTLKRQAEKYKQECGGGDEENSGNQSSKGERVKPATAGKGKPKKVVTTKKEGSSKQRPVSSKLKKAAPQISSPGKWMTAPQLFTEFSSLVFDMADF